MSAVVPAVARAALSRATKAECFYIVRPSSYPCRQSPNLSGWRIDFKKTDVDSAGCAAFTRVVKDVEPDTCCPELDCAFIPRRAIRFIGMSDTIVVAIDASCSGWVFSRTGVWLNDCMWIPGRFVPEVRDVVDSLFAQAGQEGSEK